MNAVVTQEQPESARAHPGLPSERRSQVDRNLGWIVLTILMAGCLIVVRPFVSALLWASVLCYASWPIYERVLMGVGQRRTVAALVMTAGMIIILLAPFLMVGATLAGNVSRFTAASERWLAKGPPDPPAWLGKLPLVGDRATERWNTLQKDTVQLRKRAHELMQPLSAWALRAAMALGGGLLQLTLSILIALFLFRDGAAVGERLDRMLAKVGGANGRHLLRVAGSTVRGVVYGILGTSLVQAVLAALGFLVAGVPGVGLLGLLTFFASVVPVFGTALVWIPVAIWVFSNVGTGWGVFMVVWGLVVSNIDSVIRPMLISRGSDLPFILILMGVLGGALTFGFIGIFLGPTLLAVGYRVLEEWGSGVRLAPGQLGTANLSQHESHTAGNPMASARNQADASCCFED